MILVHIIPNKPEQETANEIVDLLVDKKLILNAMIQESITIRQKDKEGQIKNVTRTLITGKTKALLFNTIDNVLQEKFGDDMPILYSTPIVNMDWKQAEELMQETTKI